MNYYPLTRQARHNGSSFHGHVPARNQNTTSYGFPVKTIPDRHVSIGKVYRDQARCWEL